MQRYTCLLTQPTQPTFSNPFRRCSSSRKGEESWSLGSFGNTSRQEWTDHVPKRCHQLFSTFQLTPMSLRFGMHHSRDSFEELARTYDSNQGSLSTPSPVDRLLPRILRVCHTEIAGSITKVLWLQEAAYLRFHAGKEWLTLEDGRRGCLATCRLDIGGSVSHHSPEYIASCLHCSASWLGHLSDSWCYLDY